jgi:hypothetical protein
MASLGWKGLIRWRICCRVKAFALALKYSILIQEGAVFMLRVISFVMSVCCGEGCNEYASEVLGSAAAARSYLTS